MPAMADASADRIKEILTLARQDGRVAVDDLAERFGVTRQTIRRDLNTLTGRRLLARTHGGAVLATGIENVGYEARNLMAAEAKAAIGRAAADLIPDNASLVIDIGTTTEAVARALLQHSGLMVVTNNINVAAEMRAYPGIEVVIAGGTVRRSDGGIVGEATVDFMRQFRADYAVIGVSGIDADGTLLDFDYREVRVAQAIIASSRQVIVVADGTKFGRAAPVRVGGLGDIDVLVTDRCDDATLRRRCRAAGVRLVETDPAPKTRDRRAVASRA